VAAAREALAVTRWAATTADPAGPAVRVEAELLLARVFAAVGDGTSSLDRATRAFDAAQALAPGPDDVVDDDAAGRVPLLLALAEAFLLTGALDEARQQYGRAQSACSDAGDAAGLVLALDGTLRAELAAGRRDEALDAARTVVAAAEHGRVPLPPPVRDGVAQALLDADRVEEAEQVLRVGLAGLDPEDETAGPVVRLRLRLVTALRRLGRVHEAGQLLEECLQVVAKPGLEPLAVDALAEQAELFAAQQQFEDAYQAQRRFHAAWTALTRERQRLAVRTRQAVLQTAEARELAAQFRDQALRDDLTGLWNRRYLDERLPGLLADRAPAPDGHRLLAAIVDLDGFKLVNDTRSHLVGDRVMQAVAAVLRESLADLLDAGPADRQGFVARLGGDECAVVLTGDPAELLAALERVREAVAGYPWRPITDGLPVTVSLGVAIATAQDTQLSLLTRADALLYRAKAAGRNRLEHDPLS
jgi:diguanylate cyclase (GGDEF)-like protein